MNCPYRYRVGLLVAAALALGLTARTAAAQIQTSGGITVADFATGFVPEGAIGPIGVAVDGSDVLIGDYAHGHLYRFGPAGGVANASTRVTSSPIAGRLSGLAFGKDHRLYAALQSAGQVVELSPTDGRVLRTIASIGNATGLATDPVTGDLFVSQPGAANGVKRISSFGSGSSGSVTQFTDALGGSVDGIAFASDGTMFASSATQIIRVNGTNSATPGRASAVTTIDDGDGIAISRDGSFLLANRTDGIMTKVGLTTSPPTKTDVVTGGTRGDFVAVDDKGCMYATQSDRVLKVGPCSFVPTDPCGAGDPVRLGRRNPGRGAVACGTEVFGSVSTTATRNARTGGYATRQSNLMTGNLAGGAAIHGCRTTSTSAVPKPCLRANNLATGLAFEFQATLGLLGGRIDVGQDPSVTNPLARPFTTNATGVATGLNADRVDGKEASELGPGDVRVATQSTASTSVPACAGTSLSACPSLLSRSVVAGNWLVQAKLVIANDADSGAATTNRCGLVQGTTELDKARNALGRAGTIADGQNESVSLMAVVGNASAGTTVSLRCTEQPGENLRIEDAKITALEVGTVTAGV